MSTAELLDSIQRAGGILEIDGEKLRCQLPKDALRFANILREHKRELIDMVKARGGRLASFPHCPKCASYSLYRKNNIGNYECLTCGLLDILEEDARRLQ